MPKSKKLLPKKKHRNMLRANLKRLKKYIGSLKPFYIKSSASNEKQYIAFTDASLDRKGAWIGGFVVAKENYGFTAKMEKSQRRKDETIMLYEAMAILGLLRTHGQKMKDAKVFFFVDNTSDIWCLVRGSHPNRATHQVILQIYDLAQKKQCRSNS